MQDTYAQSSRRLLEEAFQDAWNALMGKAKTHTTNAQYHQWKREAQYLMHDRIAAIKWQDAAYSGDAKRMLKLRSQYHLFELNPQRRAQLLAQSNAEPLPP